MRNHRQLSIPTLVLAALLIAAASAILALRIAGPGLETGVKDSRHYLATAHRLATSGELAMPELVPGVDTVETRPLSSFPPVTSWLLALLLLLGVPVTHAPDLLALLTWPLLLAAVGALTHRLSGDPVLTLFSIAVAGVTWPYLNVYTEVSSEQLYLPLTVLAVLAFDGLLEREDGVGKRLALACGLTALLLLTRYTGMFFYAAVLAWWIGGRWAQGRQRRLLRELPVLAVPGVVFALWLLRNLMLVGHPFGPVLMSSTLAGVGPAEVAASFATHGTWLVLPAVRPGPIWRSTGVAGAAVVTALGIGALVLLWRSRRPGAWRRVPRSPLVPFLVLYVGFLAVAPTFMRMRGMIERYMAVVLCLAQPWLIARLGSASRRWSYAFLSVFLVINLGFAIVFTGAHQGLGVWWRSDPLRAADLAGQPAEQLAHLLAGTPAWWVHRPPRMRDLDNHHPEVARILESLGADVAAVSNVPELFSWRPLLVAEEPVAVWLERGTCQPRAPVVIVVFDWDRWGEGWAAESGREEPSELRRRIAERCPSWRSIQTRHSTVYLPGGSGEPTP